MYAFSVVPSVINKKLCCSILLHPLSTETPRLHKQPKSVWFLLSVQKRYENFYLSIWFCAIGSNFGCSCKQGVSDILVESLKLNRQHYWSWIIKWFYLFNVRNCNICGERKILFINKMKQSEIWLRPKGGVKKIIHNLTPNFVERTSQKFA